MCPFTVQQSTFQWDIVITALTTLVAAFGGAWFAFMLQNKKEKKKVINENATALNKVQITFTQELNALTILNKDFIQPYKLNPVNWVAMPAIPQRDYSKLQIDAGSLAFLVEHGEASIISQALVVEEKFKELMNVVNLRSNFHVQQLQPKLAEIGFVEGEPYDKSVEEVEELLGVQIVSTLKRLTENVISMTADAITSHEEMLTKLNSTGKKIFPKNRIVNFEYINKDENNKTINPTGR